LKIDNIGQNDNFDIADRL